MIVITCDDVIKYVTDDESAVILNDIYLQVYDVRFGDLNENNCIIHYDVDDELLPDDYEGDKYKLINNEFVLNENFNP